MTRKWNFMVYLAGENNLPAGGNNDLAEMGIVGSTDEVAITAQFDSVGERGTERYLIRQSGPQEPLLSHEETDSGNPDSLIEFVQCAVTEFPDRPICSHTLEPWCWLGALGIPIVRLGSIRAHDYSERERDLRFGPELADLLSRGYLAARDIVASPSDTG